MGYYADKYKDRFQVNAPQRQFSPQQADKARQDESFWSGIGGLMPAIGGIGGGLIGAGLGGPAGATLGASLGGAAGQGLGGLIGGPSQERGRQVDDDEMRQMAMQQALADFYRSGY